MDTEPRIPAPFGSWKSPISAEMINRGIPSRDFPCIVNQVIYWQESRPEENGRITVVAHYPDGNEWDLLPYPFSARSKVHEYGGRSWVIGENTLFFVEQSDQRLYRLDLTSPYQQPVAVTRDDKTSRYADLVFDPSRQRILCVREEHLPDKPEAVNSIASIDLACVDPASPLATVTTLASGADFYAYPRPDTRSERLCWISWNHPEMPWDGTELWCADMTADGNLSIPQKIAGSENEAIFQPGWSPDGTLYFVSDKNGWWNLYRNTEKGIEPVHETAADFATPLWILGMCTWGFIDQTRIATLLTHNGFWQLSIIDTEANSLSIVDTPYTQMSSLSCAAGNALFIAASATITGDVVLLSTTNLQLFTIKSSAIPSYDEYVSVPQAITYKTANGDITHGFFYPPQSPDHRGADNEKPPLVVMCHGGPTGAASTALNYKIQFWTSRGFALLDVNYRGSTGFGRAYRQQLNGQWGIADVADAVAGVDFLAGEGKIDPQRVVIRGSSAGGFTTLAALTFTDKFIAGASLYGIGDLETLARDTHKFESRYMEKLVGPYPEQREIYRQRSPVFHNDKLRCPVIFLQGMEDKVVPPQQSEEMVQALKDKDIPVAYITFADEGHGFRKAANIKKALEAELVFYRRILDIASDEKLPAITIENY